MLLRAKLFLRVANIGYLPDKNAQKLNELRTTGGVNQMLNQSGVISMEGSSNLTNSGDTGGK